MMILRKCRANYEELTSLINKPAEDRGQEWDDTGILWIRGVWRGPVWEPGKDAAVWVYGVSER